MKSFATKKDFIKTFQNKKIACHSIDSAEAILNYIDTTDVFAIDEAQFFGTDIVTICNKLATMDKVVIISGLDKDFKANPFGEMPNLLSYADKVTKLKAICKKCGEFASFSQRISNHKSQVLIGEAEKYEARCRKCHKT